MKRFKVSIPWTEGLHLRPAAELVKLARRFQSSIRLRIGGRMADARSIIAILLLGATCGTVLELEVSGTDEAEALESVAALFETGGTEPEKRDP